MTISETNNFFSYLKLAKDNPHLEKEYVLLGKLIDFTHRDKRDYVGFKRYAYSTPVGWLTSKTKLTALNPDCLDFQRLNNYLKFYTTK